VKRTCESAAGRADSVQLLTARTCGVMRDPGRAAKAIDAIRAGHAVVVSDGSPSGEGALVFAAAAATRELVAFAVRHTSGYLSVSLTAEDLRRFDIPDMPLADDDRPGPAYTVSVDARENITTGISAADRAQTMRVLADPVTSALDLTRPGHVTPVHTAPGGVLDVAGIAEAAVDLARLAGSSPAAALGHLISQTDDRRMARHDELVMFAIEQGLAWCTIADLVSYRQHREKQLRRSREAVVPTEYGSGRAVAFIELHTGTEHLAMVYGDVADGTEILTSIHRECVTGDVLGSIRCRCRAKLDVAHAAIGSERRGVVIYVRGGAADSGMNHEDRDVSMPAAQMLADLGVKSLKLMVSGPAERWTLGEFGIQIVSRITASPELCTGAGLARAVQ
jgi:3,4-dihydroxy 2-butanone 4-phosphate synthase / GTP cyclohydrolase II